MIPTFTPNRAQRKRAERLAAKLQPMMKKAIAILGTMQSSHECGHAIVAMVLGFCCKRITLTPPKADIQLDLAKPFECLVVSYAGAAAVRILCNQREDGFGESPASDKLMAERCLTEMKEQGIDTAGAHDRAKEQAENMVRQYSKVIRKFAAALEERKILTGPDMALLLQGEGGTAWVA